MRSIWFVWSLIFIFSLFAREKKTKVMIWFEGSTHYKVLDKKKNATVYFSEWNPSIPSYLNDSNYYVAFHLDRQLDPLPHDKVSLLPIDYLAAVDDDSLVEAYLSFLENHGRTMGFHYLVLPDTSGLSIFEKEIIITANRLSPYYFISADHLTKKRPRYAKELKRKQPTICVVNQTDNIHALTKWNERLNGNHHGTFYQGLVQSYKVRFLPEKDLSDELRQSFFLKGTSLIDPNHVFPIRDTAIVYLGLDKKLRQRLSKYVKVYDRPSVVSCPIILDNRTKRKKASGNEIIIDYIAPTPEKGKASLLLAGTIENEDIIIAKMLFGAHEIRGRLAIEGHRKLPSLDYLGHSEPSKEGLDEKHLHKINDLAREAISKYATPGCQVAVAKNGSIVLEKAYGYFTYDSLKKISKKTLFDIASITKVAATLPAIALLIDQGKISLEDNIEQHLPEFAHSNKSGITIKQLLAHHSGVSPYLPFWRRALDDDRLDVFYYQSEADEARDIRTYGLKPHPAVRDSLINWIVESSLMTPVRYKYSDVGFMILHLLVEAVSHQPFDQFLNTHFYEPMGLTVTFNPRSRGLSHKDIAPTEYNQRHRNGQIWGEVHDDNAYLLGGVAGHAGLFANASDLLKLMFMFENDGRYGGKQYITKETMDMFNRRHFYNNRRGLGWDKKGWRINTASPLASDSSFGHTGFTGTMVWADPEEDLIYVFLSNRVYPNAMNTKLSQLKTRKNIHQVIYESLVSN